MKRVGKISRYLGQAWLTGVWFFLIAYFGFHAFQGENSLVVLKELRQQEVELVALADTIAAKRAALEQRTKMLSGASIDPDMLEEQVRQRLGFVHEDEVIVFVTE